MGALPTGFFSKLVAQLIAQEEGALAQVAAPLFDKLSEAAQTLSLDGDFTPLYRAMLAVAREKPLGALLTQHPRWLPMAPTGALLESSFAPRPLRRAVGAQLRRHEGGGRGVRRPHQRRRRREHDGVGARRRRPRAARARGDLQGALQEQGGAGGALQVHRRRVHPQPAARPAVLPAELRARARPPPLAPNLHGSDGGAGAGGADGELGGLPRQPHLGAPRPLRPVHRARLAARRQDRLDLPALEGAAQPRGGDAAVRHRGGGGALARPLRRHQAQAVRRRARRGRRGGRGRRPAGDLVVVRQ